MRCQLNALGDQSSDRDCLLFRTHPRQCVHRELATRWRTLCWPVFALVSIVIYFVHLSALAVYAIFVFGYELSTYLEKRRDGSSADWVVRAAAMSQFLLPASMFLAFSPTFQLNLGVAEVYDPWTKVQGVYGVLNSGHLAMDMLSSVIVGTLLLAGAALEKLTVHTRAVVAFCVLTICISAAPEVLFGSGFASYRLPIAIVLSSLQPRTGAPCRGPLRGCCSSRRRHC